MLRKLRRAIIAVHVVAALVATAVLSVSGGVQAAEPVRIGLVSAIRTILGSQGISAAEVAREMINAEGGVNGRPLEFVVYDDGNSPVEAVGAVQRLIDEDNIKIIVGPYASTQALAVLPIASAEGALLLLPASKHPKVTQTGYDKVFRMNSTVAMDGATFGAFIRKNLAPKGIAYAGDNNAVGRMFLDGIHDMFKDDPNKVVWSQFYDNSTTDFSGIITSAKASGADMLYVGGTNVEQYGNILRAAHELGFRPKHVILAPGCLNAKAVDIAAGGAEGSYSSDIYLPNFDTALNKKFVKAYTDKVGSPPEKLESLWFEAVWVLAKAMNKAGTVDDHQKIADTIHASTFESVRGDITFDETGQALSEPFIVTVRDGVIVRN